MTSSFQPQDYINSVLNDFQVIIDEPFPYTCIFQKSSSCVWLINLETREFPLLLATDYSGANSDYLAFIHFLETCDLNTLTFRHRVTDTVRKFFSYGSINTHSTVWNVKSLKLSPEQRMIMKRLQTLPSRDHSLSTIPGELIGTILSYLSIYDAGRLGIALCCATVQVCCNFYHFSCRN